MHGGPGRNVGAKARPCVGMKKLDGCWLEYGPMSLRERILRTTVPTLVEVPLYKCPEPLVEVLVEVGAPCLRELYVSDTQVLRTIMRRPDALGELELLTTFPKGWRLPDMCILASALAQGAWPKLEYISFSDMEVGREGFQTLLQGLATRLTTQAKPLDALSVRGTLTDDDVDRLAEALRQGKLSPALQHFSLGTDRQITGRWALRFAEVLKEGHAPLLQCLVLGGTKVTGDGAGALVSAVLTGCPLLTELILRKEIEQAESNALQSMIRSAKRKPVLSIRYFSL